MKKITLSLSLSLSVVACAYTGNSNTYVDSKPQNSITNADKTGVSFSNGQEQYQLLNQNYTPNNAMTLNAQASTRSSQQQYAYNPRTGNVAVITGDIKVSFKPGADIHAIAKQYSIDVKSQLSFANIAFLSIREGQDIVQITNHLTQHSDITSAEVDVVEHFFQPM